MLRAYVIQMQNETNTLLEDCMYLAHNSPAASYQEVLMMSPYERRKLFKLIKQDIQRDIAEKTGKEIVF